MNSPKSAVQQCPICRARQPLEATRCSACGAALNGIPVTFPRQTDPKADRRSSITKSERPVSASWEDGETDLYEGSLPALPVQAIILGLVLLVLVAGGLFMVG